MQIDHQLSLVCIHILTKENLNFFFSFPFVDDTRRVGLTIESRTSIFFLFICLTRMFISNVRIYIYTTFHPFPSSSLSVSTLTGVPIINTQFMRVVLCVYTSFHIIDGRERKKKYHNGTSRVLYEDGAGRPTITFSSQLVKKKKKKNNTQY